MVSKILGDEKGLALREIQRGRLLFSLGGDIQSTRDTFKSLKSGVQTEGFEMLMEVRSSGNKIEIYMMEGEIDDYVLFVSGNEGNFVLEILGNLSANAIRDISQLDMNVLADIFQDEKVKTDANEMQNP